MRIYVSQGNSDWFLAESSRKNTKQVSRRVSEMRQLPRLARPENDGGELQGHNLPCWQVGVKAYVINTWTPGNASTEVEISFLTSINPKWRLSFSLVDSTTARCMRQRLSVYFTATPTAMKYHWLSSFSRTQYARHKFEMVLVHSIKEEKAKEKTY